MGLLSPIQPRFYEHDLVLWLLRMGAGPKKEEGSFKTLNSIGRLPSGHSSAGSSPGKQAQQRQRTSAGHEKMKAAESFIGPPCRTQQMLSSPNRLKRMPRTWPTQHPEANRRSPSPNRLRSLSSCQMAVPVSTAPQPPPQTVAATAGGSMREPQQNVALEPCYFCGDAIEDFRVRYAEYKHKVLPRQARFTCCDCVWLSHTYKR